MTDYLIELSLADVCKELQLNTQVCVELVEYGIVIPRGHSPSDWAFDPTMVTLVRRAVRLHHDLELEWSDVAMIAELLDEREQLKAENLLLKRQLARFLSD